MRKSGYEDEKERMNWVLVSRDQLLDQYQVADTKTAMCLQDLKELYYDFSFYSLVSFFIFLE